MRVWAFLYLTALSLAALAAPASAFAQEIALRVNGEPITSHDIVQRALFQALPTLQHPHGEFFERLGALLAGDKAKEEYQQKMAAAQPHTPIEIQRASERIKKELFDEAALQILSERAAVWKAAIEAVIGDKLKLQAAKRLGIEIGDEDVAKSIMVDRLAEGEEPDVNAFYAPRVAYGISRKTFQDIIRAQLAWRAVMNRTYGPAALWERDAVYEGFSRGLLERLRRSATVAFAEERPAASLR